MKRWRPRTCFALLIVSCALVSASVQAQTEFPEARLSWDPGSQTSDLPQPPDGVVRLFLHIEGITDSARVEYQIQYGAPVASNVSFWVLKADSLFLPEAFQPTGLDTTLLGGTVEGPAPELSNPETTPPCVLLRFAAGEEVPAMTFRLSRVIVRTAEGRTIKPIVTNSDVTIRGGFGVPMPPHIRVAQMPSDELSGSSSDAWVRVVAEGLDSGWTLSLGSPEEDLHVPDELSVYGPHILARFGGSATLYEDQWVLLANSDGRTSGRPIRDVAFDPECIFVVGTDCGSIQGCINQADEGCIVEIPPGTYTENLTLDKNIRIWGDGSNWPTIDGQGNRILHVIGPLPDAEFANASLVGGEDEDGGGGVELDAGNEVAIGRCEIVGCSAVSEGHQTGHGGGILDRGNGSNDYIAVEFTECESSLGGAGLAVVPDDIFGPSTAPFIQDCVFTDNAVESEGDDRRGGQAYLDRCTAVLLNGGFVASLESNESLAHEGGAVHLDGCDGFTITGTYFIGNQVLADDDDEEGLGGALLLDNSSGLIERVTFEANRAQWAGGAIYARNCESIEVRDSWFDSKNLAGIEDNSGSVPRIRGGAVALSNSGGAVRGNLFRGNEVVDAFQMDDPDLLGGALYVSNFPGVPFLEIRNNTFVENAAVAATSYPSLALGGVYLENLIDGLVPSVVFANNIVALTKSEDPAFYCKGDWSSGGPDGHFSCNDVWNNDGGNTGGDPDNCLVIDEDFNFSADPLFVNWCPDGDYYIDEDDSPCYPGNHPEGPQFCGLIGAYAHCPVVDVPDEEVPDWQQALLPRLIIGNSVGTGRIRISKLVTPSRVSWKLFDPGGRLAARGELPEDAGRYSVDLVSASRHGWLASGVYFIRLTGDDVDVARRVVVIR